MTAPSDDFSAFVPVYDSIPGEWADAQNFLVERLREITNGVNARDFAYYYEDIISNGQQWQPGTLVPPQPRVVLRKVIDVGPLNDYSATPQQTVAHGITTSANTCITRLYGAASDPGASTLTLGIPLPFLDVAGANSIGLSIDATNIILDGTTDMSAYTCAWIVVEWIDEA